MTASESTVEHPSGLVGLIPVEISRARRAGMRATEHVTGVPVFYVSRTIELQPSLQQGRALGVTPTEILVIAAATALRAYPAAHSCLLDGAVHEYSSTRVAVLVRSGDALVPLVFPDAENTTAVALKQDRVKLQELLAGKRLPTDRMAAPTFVISNLGTYGVDWFTAVLFPGNAMTLAVGRANVNADSTTVQAVLTCDHRIVDGVDGAEFLAALERAIKDVTLSDQPRDASPL
jgi:pyruvate dehydrogenase E2 component (dihydrolipoamide acetyltransferase)